MRPQPGRPPGAREVPGQVDHQLLVGGARVFYSVSDNDYFPAHQRLALVSVLPDPEALAALYAAEKQFWAWVQSGSLPDDVR